MFGCKPDYPGAIPGTEIHAPVANWKGIQLIPEGVKVRILSGAYRDVI